MTSCLLVSSSDTNVLLLLSYSGHDILQKRDLNDKTCCARVKRKFPHCSSTFSVKIDVVTHVTERQLHRKDLKCFWRYLEDFFLKIWVGGQALDKKSELLLQSLIFVQHEVENDGCRIVIFLFLRGESPCRALAARICIKVLFLPPYSLVSLESRGFTLHFFPFLFLKPYLLFQIKSRFSGFELRDRFCVDCKICSPVTIYLFLFV